MSGLPTLPAERRALIQRGQGRLHVAADITGRGDWATICGDHVHGTTRCRVRAWGPEAAPEVAEERADRMCPRCKAIAFAVQRDPDHVALPR